MKQVYDTPKMCCGCTSCYSCCPVKAITMTEDEEGFVFPSIDQKLCVDCGRCQQVCPFISPEQTKDLSYQEVYAVQLKDTAEMNNSTSGGAFYALAQTIFNKDGFVYGAAMNSDFSVSHARATNDTELQGLRRSKYIQSVLNDTFLNVKADLQLGKPVLFTGTPCQCAGLQTAMAHEKNKEGLIVADIICSGVPSPLLWKMYCEELEVQAGQKLEEIYFRNKEYPWTRNGKGKAVSYRFEGTKEFIYDELFNTIFLSDRSSLRTSCYQCPFTETRRPSDITIADYWGIEKYAPQFYNASGVSMVFINTDKGRNFWNYAEELCITEQRPQNECLPEQQKLRHPPREPEHRQTFWNDVRKKGFINGATPYMK